MRRRIESLHAREILDSRGSPTVAVTVVHTDGCRHPDDQFDYIKRDISEQTCNSALIKLNQIGTVTGTIEAIQLCRQAGWGYIVSQRSGETEDNSIADFAVAMSGGQIKTGSLCRSQRVAKYDRLLEIEEELGAGAVFGV